MAKELRRLRAQVTKLHDEIRGGAIPSRNPRSGPVLPTEPERRLRPLSADDPEQNE
jgi:hypothetical protein